MQMETSWARDVKAKRRVQAFGGGTPLAFGWDDENRSDGTFGLISILKQQRLTKRQNFEQGMSNFEGILVIRSAFDIPCSSFVIPTSFLRPIGLAVFHAT